MEEQTDLTKLVTTSNAVRRFEINGSVISKSNGRINKVQARSEPIFAQVSARYPLSYAQQRLWFVDRLEEGSAEYNLPVGLRLRGGLDREALERTIQTIVDRHESLRTHFEEENGEVVQVIDPTLRIKLSAEDLSGLDEVQKENKVQEALRQEGEESFDLSRGPLLRMRPLKLGEREHVLLRTMHHIVSDGWSQILLNHEYRLCIVCWRSQYSH